MTTTYIPTEDHVIRIVPWARLRKDADFNVVGIEAAAFRLRDKEPYLSATWLEFFKGSPRAKRLHAAVRAIRKSNMRPTPKSGLAIGNVAKIVNQCASRNRRIRVIHEPEDDNRAHVALRQWPSDDEQLLELLARDAWSELVLNKDIPT
jgi:hypothetical protein